ncbi:AraC family transcriptional regulator [Massilia sp. TS11]|uniref:AraC family transcriptional regulator n=1 Tax=Massilia sp. TS11 TaxID=2908003 RepID=UPI001EDA70DB|nr:AraC family transcriptional regulator [Massilia sp. TS11]MCG2584973.1 AraC family transcriptional regulator [Massilia sp. TS11]
MLIREWVGASDGPGWRYLHEVCQGCGFFWHYHPEFELTFTRGGRGTRYIGSDADSFGDLDLALVAPNQPHTWHSPEAGQDKEVQVIFFTLDWLRGLAGHGASELNALVHWLAQIQTGAVFSPAFSARMAPHFARLAQSEGLARLGCLFEILGQLQHDRELRLLQGYRAGVEDRRLAAALAYLQAHYTEALSLDDLAAAARSSPATIKRLFAQQMQTSFSALLAQLRIGHACRLLQGEQPIPVIAEASGFPSLSQFYRKFQELQSQSPAAYRRQQRRRP